MISKLYKYMYMCGIRWWVSRNLIGCNLVNMFRFMILSYWEISLYSTPLPFLLSEQFQSLILSSLQSQLVLLTVAFPRENYSYVHSLKITGFPNVQSIIIIIRKCKMHILFNSLGAQQKKGFQIGLKPFLALHNDVLIIFTNYFWSEILFGKTVSILMFSWNSNWTINNSLDTF